MMRLHLFKAPLAVILLSLTVMRRRNGMRILVTGGAGYVGSVACELLRAKGHDIGVLDSLTGGHRAAVDPDVPLWQVDLNARPAVETCLDEFRPDAVLHFAAFCLVGESMTDPGKYVENNVVGSLRLLQSMVSKGVGKIVFSSSAAVYGQPDAVPIGEDESKNPTNPYGASKAMVEELLKWYWEAHGVRSVSLRYFNAAGATASRGEDHDPETHLIPLALGAAMGTQNTLHVFGRDYPTGDGTCVRDYVHVRDLAEAHILALEKMDAFAHECFNLGTGIGYSVEQVTETIREVTGLTVPTVDAPRRAGDPAVLVASFEKAKRHLGWTPRFSSLPDIVRSAYEWMVSHPGGYPE